MGELLIQPFADNEFMLRALAAGLLVALACAPVGVLVVLRGLAFVGDALAHGVLPGVAGALLLGVPAALGAAVGAAAMIGGVSLVQRRSALSGDTAIGLLFVAMLALGVVLVSRSTSFAGDLLAILFGDVLAVDTRELVLQAVATVLVVAAAVACHRPFLLLCVDEDQAEVAGFSARRYHALLLVLVAACVVTALTTVGTLLVFGMLVAPGAIGTLLAPRLGAASLVAAAAGALSVVSGLLLAYHADFPAGASIVLVAVALFTVTLAWTSWREGTA